MGHGAYSVPPWGKPGVCQPMGTGAECTRMPGIALPQHLALPPKKKEEKFNGGEQTGKTKMFHICFIFYLSSYMNFASTIATRQSGGSNGVAFLIRGCSPLKCTWLSWSFGFYFATINLQHLFLFTGFGGSRCFPS